MSQYMMYSHYKEELEKWCKSIKEGNPPEEYHPIFFASITEQTNLNVTYDKRIVQCLKFNMLYLKYSKFTIKQLQNITNQLFKAKYITARELEQIKHQENTNIDTLAEKYIGKVKEALAKTQQKDQGNIVNFIWESIFPIPLNIFWQLVLFSNIISPALYPLKEVTFLFSQIQNKQAIQKHLQSLRNTTDNVVTELSRQMRKIKIDDRRPETEKSKKRSQQNIFEIKQSQSMKIQKEVQRRTSSFQARNPLVTFVRQKDLKQTYLQLVGMDHGLFFGPQNQQLVDNIFSFIQLIKNDFQFDDEFQIDLFGSLRSRLAVKDEYDIDFTYVSNRNRVIIKSEGINILKKYLIQIDHMAIPWIQYGEVINIPDPKMPPYLKIRIHQDQFYDIFNIDIDKIDLTTSNNTAVINSQFLSHFSNIKEIGQLCILVKIWAKKWNVINKKYPMRGLSAYGVIMMCLYYLMKTGQVNFLEFTEEQLANIQIGSLIPRFSVLRFKTIYENLTGFFNYYRENGRYFQEKPIICLLKNSEKGRNVYNPQFIYNMYDFMDRTNPGRLKDRDKIPVLRAFSYAYYIMEGGSINQIQSLIQN